MDIHAIAQQRFNIPYLRPFQQLVIKRIIEDDRPQSHHRPTVVILPTGGGKSLCYMLPATVVEGLIIIVYPLLSLMNDQRRRFERAGIECVQLQGNQSIQRRRHCFAQIDDGVKVVITNAETLEQPQILSQLGRHTISVLVLDEAHTIVSWGKGFRPSLARLGLLITHLPVRQLLLFTATADALVLAELNRLIYPNRRSHLIRASSNRANISYHVTFTLSPRRAVTTYLKMPQSRPALVFCRTRRLCETMSEHFRFCHPAIPTFYYHAGLSKAERQRIEDAYIDDRGAVLFATNAFGMGVDKSDIRTVIHTYLPPDALSFLQESGRGGRDGRHCHSLVLLKANDVPSSPLYAIFSQDSVCFRSLLLNALDERVDTCSGCDVCDNTYYKTSEGEQAIIAAVRHKVLGHSVASLIEQLTDDRIRYRHSGHLAGWQACEVNEAIQTLIAAKKIRALKRGGRLYCPPSLTNRRALRTVWQRGGSDGNDQGYPKRSIAQLIQRALRLFIR